MTVWYDLILIGSGKAGREGHNKYGDYNYTANANITNIDVLLQIKGRQKR